MKKTLIVPVLNSSANAIAWKIATNLKQQSSIIAHERLFKEICEETNLSPAVIHFEKIKGEKNG